MLGAKIIMECLVEQGVDTIFGYPGGQNMPLYNALYDYTKSGKIKHYLTAHEQGATHAADAYARSSKKAGVCFVTSGPGATNTVTGIATAHMDSSPLVVITGQVPVASIGRDAFQEVDIVGITLPIVKHSFALRDVNEIAPAIRKAFAIALSGRPGPVLIDIPKDLTVADAPFKKLSKDEISKIYKGEQDIENQTQDKDFDFSEIAEIINSAKRPVIHAGGGIPISNAEKELMDFAKKSDIPVATTLMALGSFPKSDKLFLGMVGMHGGTHANFATHKADVLIELGGRFSDRVISDPSKFAKNQKVIHIDIDHSELSKNVSADYEICMDLKKFLKKLLPFIQKKNRTEWVKQIESKKVLTGHMKGLTPNFVFKTIQDILGPTAKDAIIATDVGQHQMWTAQKWNFEKKRKLMTSGGLGTMGFGLGAAIGAKVANKNERVILFTGDGSFRMNLNELATLSSYKIPITIFVFKNTVLGMVRQWQKLFFDKRYSETNLKDVIDYEKLGETFGIKGTEVKTQKDFIEKAKEALSVVPKKDDFGARIIAIDISENENVWPIVPPGEAIYNQVLTEN